MIVLDILTAFAVIAIVILGGSAVIDNARMKDKEKAAYDRAQNEMRRNLARALESQDYKQLDIFLIMHRNDIDAALEKLVLTRRNELYIDSNS